MTELVEAYSLVRETFSLTRWLMYMAGVVSLVRVLAMTFNRYGISYTLRQEAVLVVGMGLLMTIFQRTLHTAVLSAAIVVGANFYNRWRPWWDDQRRRS